jgi:WD40 repeat protein
MLVHKIAQLMGHNAAVFAVAAGKTPPYILSGAGDGWVVEWDLSNPDTGQLLAKVERNIFALLYHPETQTVVVGDMDGGVRFVDLANGHQTRNIQHHGGKGCFDMKIIGNQLFTVGGDGVISRWSIAERRSLDGIHLSQKSLRCLDFSEKRHEIAIGASDGTVYFLETDRFEYKEKIAHAHNQSIFSICYAPDNQTLLTGGRDAYLKAWHLTNRQINPAPSTTHYPLSYALAAHLFTINAICFHPEKNNLFATASRDRTIKIWSISDPTETFENGEESGQKVLTLVKVIDTVRQGCHLRSVNRLFWSSYQNYLISASDDRSLMVWQVEI